MNPKPATINRTHDLVARLAEAGEYNPLRHLEKILNGEADE